MQHSFEFDPEIRAAITSLADRRSDMLHNDNEKQAAKIEGVIAFLDDARVRLDGAKTDLDMSARAPFHDVPFLSMLGLHRALYHKALGEVEHALQRAHRLIAQA